MFVTFHLLRFANYVSNIFIFGKVIQFASHPCHCNSFSESNFWKRQIVILIFGIATFCLKHCLNSPRHAFNQILTNRWFYLLPLLLKPIPQLMNTTGRLFILPVTISSPIVWIYSQVPDLGSACKLAPQSLGLPQTERLSMRVLKLILKLREVSPLVWELYTVSRKGQVTKHK